MPVHHVNNGDGSVTQFDSDTGQELVTFLDPDGSFTRDHVEPAAGAPAQELPTGMNRDKLATAARGMSATQPVIPDNTVVQAQPQLTPSEQAFQSHLGNKSMVQEVVEKPAAAAPPAPAPVAPRPTGAGMPIASVSSQGLDPASQAKAAANRERYTAAQTEADNATTASEQAQLDAQEARVQAESERALGQRAADDELKARAQASFDRAQAYSRQARATPIEPAKALGGEKFFYAIMANVGAALSNFGSALLGQGATMDPNVVDDIIADGVKLQLEQKRTAIEGADQDLGIADAELSRAKIQANASLEKFFEAQAAVEKMPEVRAALAANAAQRTAAREAETAKLAEIEYRQENVERKPAAPGALPLNLESAEDQAIIQQNGATKDSMAKYAEKRLATGADQVIETNRAARETIEKLANGQDVPGVGPIDKFMDQWTRDPDGAAVQQALGMGRAQFIKAISGATVSESERKVLDRIVEGRGTLDDIKRGLDFIDRSAKSSLDALTPGFSGEARAYEQIRGRQRARARVSDEAAARRDAQLGRSTPAPATAAATAPERRPTPARSLDSLTGQDEVQYQAAERRRRIEQEGAQEERRNRLRRFLQ